MRVAKDFSASSQKPFGTTSATWDPSPALAGTGAERVEALGFLLLLSFAAARRFHHRARALAVMAGVDSKLY